MIGKPGFKWSDDELAVLRESLANGDNYGQVGRKIGRTEEAVATKARSLGLASMEKVRLWTIEEDERLCQLRAEGKQNKEICKILDRNRGSIDKRIQHLGLTNARPLKAPVVEGEEPKPVWTYSEDKLELVRLWQEANQRQANSRLGGQKTQWPAGGAATPAAGA